MRLPFDDIIIEMRKRTWTNESLIEAVKTSRSYRQVISKLNLREAGGNYEQIKKYIKELGLNIDHFLGEAWNKGNSGYFRPFIPIEDILVKGNNYQSYKLKKRLFRDRLKVEACELCGWAKSSVDGRIPVELDHINGDRHDNRLENLRILCPNCHSLQSTHRGKNIKPRKLPG